jgi:hypothetical protein
VPSIERRSLKKKSPQWGRVALGLKDVNFRVSLQGRGGASEGEG